MESNDFEKWKLPGRFSPVVPNFLGIWILEEFWTQKVLYIRNSNKSKNMRNSRDMRNRTNPKSPTNPKNPKYSKNPWEWRWGKDLILFRQTKVINHSVWHGWLQRSFTFTITEKQSSEIWSVDSVSVLIWGWGWAWTTNSESYEGVSKWGGKSPWYVR
jgi:hypothetical protein